MRVLLVDDQSVVRDTLKSILGPYSDVDIIGEATNGEEAVLKVSQLQPDVVIMDIVMPRLDGIAAAREIQTASPETPIVGLSLHAKSYEVNAMLEAGAVEVINKEKAVDELYRAIQRVVAQKTNNLKDSDCTIQSTCAPLPSQNL